MNLKRTFGTILTIIGVAGLIYGAVLFVQGGNGSTGVRAIATYGILGAIFFFTGIGLIRSTRDES